MDTLSCLKDDQTDLCSQYWFPDVKMSVKCNFNPVYKYQVNDVMAKLNEFS